MAKKPKSDYEKLRDEWYEKLKTEKSDEYPDGFVDIEQDEDTLKSWSAKFRLRMKDMPKEVWVAKVTYYQMAANFLNDYNFQDLRDKPKPPRKQGKVTFTAEVQRVIWEYHANGLSYRDIATTLNKAKIKKVNYDGVMDIVRYLKSKMYPMYSALEQDPQHE